MLNFGSNRTLKRFIDDIKMEAKRYHNVINNTFIQFATRKRKQKSNTGTINHSSQQNFYNVVF